MKGSHKLALLVVVAPVLMSGCFTSGQYHSVVFGGGAEDNIGIQDGQFVMTGNISVGMGAAPDRNFSNVSVVLYDSEKQMIERTRVGNLSTNPAYYPTSRRINITSTIIPEFVVIESPDFWTTDTALEIEGHELQNGTYYTYGIHEDQKFPDE